MISYLTGKIIDKQNQKITVLTTGGVGYEVGLVPLQYLGTEVGQEISLHTYLAIRENAQELYGFQNLAEKDLFLKFLDVSGVGPKTALHLLSLGTVNEISGAIARGDVEYLTKVSGVGRKTAERIVVELKAKMQNADFKMQNSEASENLGEVVEALVSLGYSKDEARQVVKNLDAKDKTSEQLLREALKNCKF